jgi:integrator complex subunit 11
MLHGGQSLKIFKKWCGDEKNMVIMPGYCTKGTVGAKVISGAKQIEMDGRVVRINELTQISITLCLVQYQFER